MPDDTELLAVLESLRERGALGETSLPHAVAHADLFLAAIPATCTRLIDLGSGGGLPGLVLASRLTDASIVLCDRRERRMDLLRLACTRLGLLDRVTVITADVVALARQPEFQGDFDVVTARAFGDPLWTLRCAEPFLKVDGVIIVSEPPTDSVTLRWPNHAVVALGLMPSPTQFSQVRRFERTPGR